MTRAEFERLVVEAVTLIPKRFRREMKNVAVIVEDEPSPAILEEMDIEPGDTLFGLYQGTPLPERGWAYGNTLPDRISIFQGPIEEACADDEEIRAHVDVPIVDGVMAGVKLAEAIHQSRLKTSKVAAYAWPERKELVKCSPELVRIASR